MRHCCFLTKEKGKDFVTLWGILLREARGSSKARDMFPLHGKCSGVDSRNLALAWLAFIFPAAPSCNTIPHSVARIGGHR
jgi:hypothetical protein